MVRQASKRPSVDGLLTTKLHIPHLRSHLVHRPRLIQRLQQGMERTMILLSAPVGYGKSTLLFGFSHIMFLPPGSRLRNRRTSQRAFSLTCLQPCEPTILN
jgi:hypothetical protein